MPATEAQGVAQDEEEEHSGVAPDEEEVDKEEDKSGHKFKSFGEMKKILFYNKICDKYIQRLYKMSQICCKYFSKPVIKLI